MSVCEIVFTDRCVAAADDDEPVRTRCFACGLRACTGCTVVVPRWYRWRRKRVCQSCLVDHGHEMAGAV